MNIVNEIVLGKPELCNLGFRNFVPFFLGSKGRRIWIELPPGHSHPTKEVLCVPIVYSEVNYPNLKQLYKKLALREDRIFKPKFNTVGTLTHRTKV